MKFSKWLTVALVLFIVVAGLSIVQSFMSRRQQIALPPKTKILPPEISRQSTQFEYTEHKHGDPVFKVNAKTSTQTVENVHNLSEVSVSYFGQNEGFSDSVTGRDATYRIDEKELEFNGNILIRLADGTEIISDQANADLSQEVVRIDQHFQFTRRNVQGHGGSLVYRFPQREMKVADGLNLIVTAGSREIQVDAGAGIYRPYDQVMKFLDKPGVSGGGAKLTAEEMSVMFSGQYQIDRVLSIGQAQLDISGDTSFSGNRIDMLLDPGSKTLDQVEILGNSSSNAGYYQEARGVRLEANKIVAVLDSTRIHKGLFLERFAAFENVSFHLSGDDNSEIYSDELKAKFFEGGEHLESVNLQGGVSAVQRSSTSGSGDTQLQSKVLALRFESNEILKEARAEENVKFKLSSNGMERRLIARDFVQVNYQGGIPNKIVSQGDCLLESIMTDGADRVRASQVTIHYKEGLFDRIIARDGVRVESLRHGEQSYTTSEHLDIVYRDGVMHEVVQKGKVRFWDGEPVTLELRSDLAEFDPRTGIIVATGTQPPTLRTIDTNSSGIESAIVTRAHSFTLDKYKGHVLAQGGVSSVFGEGVNSTLINAGLMKVERTTGWVEYSINPNIVQGDNSIRGQVVKYNYQDQQLVVETDVKSSFFEDGPLKNRQYTIESDRLVHNQQALRASFEGGVRLKTREVIVMAPFMELFFSDAGAERVQKIIAWGGVQVIQEGRKAEGERAEHHPSEGKVLLMGNPAQVVETNKGKVMGSRLTFYAGDKRILVEGRSSVVTP